MLTNAKEEIVWIDVDDELPDDCIELIVFTESGLFYLAYLSDGIWYDDRGNSIMHYPVVAWAKMPSGPKKNEVKE